MHVSIFPQEPLWITWIAVVPAARAEALAARHGTLLEVVTSCCKACAQQRQCKVSMSAPSSKQQLKHVTYSDYTTGQLSPTEAVLPLCKPSFMQCWQASCDGYTHRSR
jgi:hypothetical protein